MPQTWGDIAQQLDANMPQAQYDALRDKYFKDVVAPKIRPGFDPNATYKAFIDKTQRPSTISAADKFLLKAGQFTSAAVKAMVPGEGGAMLTKQLDDSITPIATREGVESPTLEKVGSFIGQGIALEALLPAAGAIGAKLLPAATEGAKAAIMAQKVARGGLAFATYDALEAKDGDRVAAGIKGAAMGAGAELVIGGLFGFGEKAAAMEKDAAHTLTKDAVLNEAPPPIQEAVSKDLVQDAAIAKKSGMTKGPLDVTPTKRGLQVTLTDEKGVSTVIPVPRGKEDDIIPLIQQTLDMGGGFDAIEASPRQMARAGRILRAFGDKAEAVRTEKPLTAFTDLRGPVTRADFPDDLSFKAYQAGEIRHRIRESGAKVGPTVPNAEHRLLNDYARDIGQSFGLSNREEAGDQALTYFGKVKGSTGNIESVSDQLSKYAGTGKYDWTRADMPQFGKEKIDPERGNLSDNLRDIKVDSQHPWIPKGQKGYLKPPPSEMEGAAFASDRDLERFKTVKAGDVVDGRVVRSKIPNMDSISASLDNYTVLKGVREVPMSSFDSEYLKSISLDKMDDHTKNLVGALKQSGELNPLIVALDSKGAYVIEGGHRFDALIASKAKSVPALVVIDEDSPPTRKFINSIFGGGSMDIAAEGRVRVRPVGTTKVLPIQGDLGAVSNGVRILSEDATRGTVYHEAVHDGIIQSGLESDFGSHIPELHETTAKDLAKGIRSKFPSTYAGHDEPMMLNEAFTHAAEAVRVGNVGALDELGRMDTDTATVKGFVNETAGNLWEGSLVRDTAPSRAFQRRMVDLVRRTSDAPSLALKEAENTGWRTWFDPELGQWIMRDGDGRTVMKKEVREVWDHLNDHDPSDQFPDGAHKAYFRAPPGAGGPGVSGPSVTAMSSPEHQEPALGWESLRSLWAPTEASAAGVAKKFAQAGKSELGTQYYDAFKGALEKEKMGRAWQEKIAQKYDSIMKGLSREKLLDYGEVLAHAEGQWSAMASQLKLGADDLARIRAFSELDKQIVTDGGISPMETLKSLRAVRAANGDISVAGASTSPVVKALNSGSLTWGDFNIGKSTTWALRESVTKQFTGDSLTEIDRLSNMRTADGKLVFGPMQYSMQNFTRYMRNNRDQSGKIMDSLLNGMIASVEKKGVAAGLKSGWTKAWGFGDSKSALSMYLKVMATANLGGRPVSMVRDAVSGLLQLSVGGPKLFAEGMSRMMSKEGRLAGEKYLMKEADIAGYFGDTTGSLAESKAIGMYNRFSDLALTPTRVGSNIPRMVAGLGEESRALREIARYRAGKIDAGELINNTGAWFQDAAPKARLLAIATDASIPVEKAAEQFGFAFNDATQFPMSRGTQGAAFRTGAGKLLGQYGTWPANYAQFVRKLAARSLENPKNGVPALATFIALNFAALKSAQAFSIDASNWFFFSPIGYSGSPTLSLLQAAAAAPEETQAGHDARAELIKSVSQSVIPLGTQFRSMMKAFGDDGSVSVPRLLGFKTLKEQDQDWNEWLKTESGLK